MKSLSYLALVLIFTFVFFAQKYGSLADPSKIDPKLRAILEEEGKVSVFVSFNNGVQSTLDSATAVRYDDPSARNTGIKLALEQNADNSQAGVVGILSTRDASEGDFRYFKRYWIGNKVVIKDASAAIIEQVSEDPEVRMITKEPTATAFFDIEDDAVEEDDAAITRKKRLPEDLEKYTWGLRKMQVPEAWEELGGSRGEGIIVAHIDSGVDQTHESLRDNWIGPEYGWFDAVLNRTEPYDDRGHGTATMSLLAGLETGVAPGAKWMTCTASRDGYLEGEHILDCMQWLSCPTLPDGSNPDCSKIPHLVSNSWVSDRDVDDFNEAIWGWRALGITPIFGIGNDATLECYTTKSPGEQPFVIGVGGVWKNDNHAGPSSIGPAADGGIKPDIVAPGSGVLVAAAGYPENYLLKSGTSMATPHAAGLVALLKVREPDISYDQIFDLLIQNTQRNLSFHESFAPDVCNETDYEVYPNWVFGYGLINALKTVQAQTALLSQASST